VYFSICANDHIFIYLRAQNALSLISGDENPNAPCMQNGRCTKNFPKPFRDQTSISEDSYASTRRRDTGRTHQVRGKQVGNRWVVTYCAYLIWKYRCHINIESIASIKAVKYIYKYVYKGHDRITMQFGTCNNEVKQYLDARYISSCESIWRLFHFLMHCASPNVVRLQVHLPGQQYVTWNQNGQQTMQEIVQHAAERDTTLTAFFKANQEYPEIANNLLYQDFPSKFTSQPKTLKWKPRQRGFAIRRMYYVPPTAGERYYLRLLLTAVKGPTSFDDLRTFQGNIAPSFREACLARGLLENDQEWEQCLEEGKSMATGYQLRVLFVTILRDCAPSNPVQLWNTYWPHICDDLRYHLQHNNIRVNPTDNDIEDYGLYLINQLLLASGKSLAKDFKNMPQITQDWEANIGNRLIAEQRRYDAVEQAELAAQNQDTFNLDQRAAFDQIMDAVNNKTGQTFFLHGPGGTGKTYVYSTLCYQIRSQGKIVLCMASSGIAALLLPGGHTSHSSLQIPLITNDPSTCTIAKGTHRAQLLQQTELIIWDEALMQHRHLHEAVNRTLKDILESDKPFGGVPVVFSGDFHQILPVIERGSRPQIVGASLQRSLLWQHIKVLHLRTNMCLNTDDLQEREFARWQLEVGKGGHTDELGNITLPDHFKCAQNTIHSLIDTVYPGIYNQANHSDQYFSQRVILASKNDDVDDLNHHILSKLPGQEHVFHSADSIANNENGELLYPAEYLNSINCSGLPLAHMALKIGCPVMVLQNLNMAGGVCNGTRGILTRMRNKVLEIRLITGDHAGEKVFIPRMRLQPIEGQLPFTLSRLQFPVRLSFSMTINKSQGQSVQHVGLNFRSPVFTHGQFYVAISRVQSVHNIKAIWDSESESAVTKNIVYNEVLIG
jgi:PIF1-like helicase/Helicase